MQEFLVDLGFKKYDVALLLLCPLGAVIGSFAHAMLLLINPHRIPRPGTTQFNTAQDALGRAAWLTFRLSLGAILGLVVGLYFIGALQENTTTLAKVVALSILLGFAAPKIWVAQEQLITDAAERRLKELLESRVANSSISAPAEPKPKATSPPNSSGA
jgi:hypothetical protein